jgi:hypothetical protein
VGAAPSSSSSSSSSSSLLASAAPPAQAHGGSRQCRQAAPPPSAIAPLRKHAAPVPLALRGSTTGATDGAAAAAQQAPLRVDAAFGRSREDAALAVHADALLAQSLGVLVAMQLQREAGAAGAAGAPAEEDALPLKRPRDAEGAEGAETAALRARVRELEAESARWQAVNTALMARVAGRV